MLSLKFEPANNSNNFVQLEQHYQCSSSYGPGLAVSIISSSSDFSFSNIEFRLTPLHAQWLLDMYNFFTTAEVIAKGWKKAGITGLLYGNTNLPCEDPFEMYYP